MNKTRISVRTCVTALAFSRDGEKIMHMSLDEEAARSAFDYAMQIVGQIDMPRALSATRPKLSVTNLKTGATLKFAYPAGESMSGPGPVHIIRDSLSEPADPTGWGTALPLKNAPPPPPPEVMETKGEHGWAPGPSPTKRPPPPDPRYTRGGEVWERTGNFRMRAGWLGARLEEQIKNSINVTQWRRAPRGTLVFLRSATTDEIL